jgi:ATP-dependent helicase/nuclease subunit B
MSALIEHCRKTLARLATEITDGKIEVSPYRLGDKDTPCPRCDYHSLCRFDFNSESYNELPSMSKQDVLDQIEM